MTTLLEKTLKRELRIKGRPFIVAISPEALKLTAKGKRNGLELRWDALVSGDAALAVALNASIGRFTSAPAAPMKATPQPKTARSRPAAKRRS